MKKGSASAVNVALINDYEPSIDLLSDGHAGSWVEGDSFRNIIYYLHTSGPGSAMAGHDPCHHSISYSVHSEQIVIDI